MGCPVGLARVGGLCAAIVALALGGCHTSLDGGAHPPGGGLPHGDGGHATGDGGHPTGSPSADGGVGAGLDAGLGNAGGPGGVARGDGSAPVVDMGRSTQAVCPGDGPALAPAASAPARVATPLPTSCNPLARTLVLPPAPTGAPGLFHRCATFSAAAVHALALAPDGRLAAMVNGDGVARIVEVATQEVVALVAPPRARVTRVAFSPDGASLVTVSGAEHEVTLTRTSDWTALWTVTLPGPLYGFTDGSAGAAAFSPDGTSIAVSPGADLYLLDAASGAIQASYPSEALLEVAYALRGRRIVAADAILTATGTCGVSPLGGAIVVLDPHTLAKLATVTSWAGGTTDGVVPAFRASPADDEILTPPSARDQSPTIEAFKISDGSPLPGIGLTSLPAAVLPDGDLVIAENGELGIERPTDGTLAAEVAAPTPASPVVAVSGDGSTVAIGGDGADLLRVWSVAQSYALGVCTFDDVAPGQVALSGDGRVVALAIGQGVTVVRPDDGTVLSKVTGDGEQVYELSLSRTGRYVAMHFSGSDDTIVVNTADDGLMADFAKLPGGKGYLEGYVFSPDELILAVAFSTTPTSSVLDLVDLPSRAVSSRAVPAHTRPIGFTRGCPILTDPTNGAYRSCGSCDETPVPGIYAGVVSADGSFLLTNDGYSSRTATLHTLPGGQILRTFGPPDTNADADVEETPDTVGSGGLEVLVGVTNEQPCYAGPSFATNLYDATSGAVLDQLPPWVSSDDAITRILAGSELWCRP